MMNDLDQLFDHPLQNQALEDIAFEIPGLSPGTLIKAANDICFLVEEVECVDGMSNGRIHIRVTKGSSSAVRFNPLVAGEKFPLTLLDHDPDNGFTYFLSDPLPDPAQEMSLRVDLRFTMSEKGPFDVHLKKRISGLEFNWEQRQSDARKRIQSLLSRR